MARPGPSRMARPVPSGRTWFSKRGGAVHRARAVGKRSNLRRPPGFRLLTEAEIRATVQRLVADREHWIVPWIGEAAIDLCREVEGRFYAGEASADFELVTLPPEAGVFACGFGHKRRAPAHELNALLRGWGVASEAGGDQDVLAPYYDAADLGRALMFAAWVERDGTEAR